MFSRIAPRYDFLNHLLSANLDRVWRRRLVESAGLLPRGRVMDACSGTGDIAIAFAERTDASEVIALDRSGEMLDIGRAKAARKRLDGEIHFVEGDVLDLPFESGRFDAVSIAFGLRNLADYAAGLAEMARVLVPGGRLVILEFAPPSGALSSIGYAFYLHHVIPRAGKLISGSRDAYAYLASSVSNFLPSDRVLDLMREAELRKVSAKRLTGGIVTLYRGEK
jgi:demethylmenaquinone methyltransferase/2-methoxy-6-polyprenyl-1,4-benzoquinol methylase